MKKNEMKVYLTEILFEEYMQSDDALKTPLRKISEECFFDYFEKMEAGIANPEDLGELQYNALKAGFFAGFEMAKALLS